VNVRRLRLDVDWAAGGPRIDAVGEAIAREEGVEALLITVTEVDMETIGSDVVIEGTQLDPAALIAAIEGSGAVVHSIDELAAGDRLLTFTPRAR
jgi:uncharacterized protein